MNNLPTQIEKPSDPPRTDSQRQIAAALVLNHRPLSAELRPVAVIDFYPATNPTNRSTT